MRNRTGHESSRRCGIKGGARNVAIPRPTSAGTWAVVVQCACGGVISLSHVDARLCPSDSAIRLHSTSRKQLIAAAAVCAATSRDDAETQSGGRICSCSATTRPETAFVVVVVVVVVVASCVASRRVALPSLFRPAAAPQKSNRESNRDGRFAKLELFNIDSA